MSKEKQINYLTEVSKVNIEKGRSA